MAVILWMVSIRGVDFIIHENIVSWPTAYFMKAYGKLWLQRTGFELSSAAFRSALKASIPVAAVAIVASILLRWKRSDMVAIVAKVGMVLAVIPICLLLVQYLPSSSHLHRLRQVVSAIFFPEAMVLYIAVASLIAWGILRLALPSRPALDGSGRSPGSDFLQPLSVSNIVEDVARGLSHLLQWPGSFLFSAVGLCPCSPKWFLSVSPNGAARD